MSDIFGYARDPKPKAVFSSDSAHLTIEGKGEGYMIQQWSLNYQQNVQEIFELGSSNLYWVRGQPQGQGTVGRIMGNDSDSMFFPANAFDMCQGGVAVNIDARPGVCKGGDPTGATLSLDGVVVTSFGFQSSVQDMMIHQNIQIRFASLSV